MQPFFSPDSKWIGFFANGSMKKVSISGGAPLTLCATANDPRGASWGDDGMIVFAPSTTVGLSRVRDSGGEPESLTQPDRDAKERSHRWPEVLPGSQAVLFTSQLQGTNFDVASIEVLDLRTNQRTVLQQGGSSPHYTSSGHILFGSKGTLYAAPFDSKSLTMSGQPGPVIEGVLFEPSNGGVHMAISRDGTLIFNSEEAFAQNKLLVWADRDGTTTPIDTIERDISVVSISPDGARLALQILPEGQTSDDIWTYEIERQVLSRLTFGEADEMQPVWSPDGQRIVYTSTNAASAPNLFIQNADGSDQPTRLTTNNFAQFPTDWSPDGDFVLFHEQKGKGWDLAVLDMTQDPPATRTLFETPFNELHAAFSPNGKWIAYASNESGQYEVYVRAFPGPGGRWQVSTAGGGHPVWAPDGTEIFYLDDRKVMSVPVVTESEAFSVGRPKELFAPGPDGDFFYTRIDIMSDGKRFVMLQNTGNAAQRELHELTFVFNWFEELRDRVGEGGR